MDWGVKFRGSGFIRLETFFSQNAVASPTGSAREATTTKPHVKTKLFRVDRSDRMSPPWITLQIEPL